MPKASILRELADELNISIAKLEMKASLGNGTISGLIRNDKDITKHVENYLLTHVENLNPEWIKNGVKPIMLSRQKEKPVFMPGEVMPLQLADKGVEYNKSGTPFTPLSNGQYLMEVPIVSARAQGGYASGFGDPVYMRELPTTNIVVKNIQRGTYIGFEVIGDSMNDGTPKAIESGDVVIGRQISRHLWQYKLHLHEWTKYIIHTQDGIIVKEIKEHNLEEGKILVHSSNPDKEKYPDEWINLSAVRELYNVVKVEKDLS